MPKIGLTYKKKWDTIDISQSEPYIFNLVHLLYFVRPFSVLGRQMGMRYIITAVKYVTKWVKFGPFEAYTSGSNEIHLQKHNYHIWIPPYMN